MVTGSPWGDADRLFRGNPRWRGADAAYSVPLDGDRTLWLFGDTFIGASRTDAVMVHNTIGIQEGADPTTATLTAHMGGTPEDPRPFIEGPEGTWLWPMAGARIDAGIVIFLMRVRSARPDLPTVLDAWRREGSLKFFEVFDWAAALVSGVDGPVEDWQVRMLDTPPTVNRIMPGAGATVHGGHVYAYGWRDGHQLRPGIIRRRPRYRGWWRPRLAFVLRWPVDRVTEGLRSPEWWCGDRWTSDANSAVAVVKNPGTEFTVHLDRRSGRWVLVEVAAWLKVIDDVPALRRFGWVKRMPYVGRVLKFMGLLKPSVCLRTGDTPHGPWSDPVRVYSPDVRRDVLVYAGKAHPQLTGADLVCTYAQIALKADRTLEDETLYYPRFVRITLDVPG